MAAGYFHFQVYASTLQSASTTIDRPTTRATLAPLDIPEFVPHPLLRGAHRQTIAAVYLPGNRSEYRARQCVVPLADGDRLVLHDDRPEAWRPGHRVALLIHGLAGNHSSHYMRRIAGKLNARGVRTFRMDLRGCGAGVALARLPYHSGCSTDAMAALEYLAAECPDSPATLVGFSLGGNITLKLLGELENQPCGALDSGLAVCPPLDLCSAAENIRRTSNRIYDKHFVKLLWAQMQRRRRLVAGVVDVDLTRPPRTLVDFDQEYTAPVCGFGTAENYYRTCSSAQFVPRIHLPTLILASLDDPLIPNAPYKSLKLPESVQLHLTHHGGHLGFIGRPGPDPDRRWMDWRVVDWVVSRGVA